MYTILNKFQVPPKNKPIDNRLFLSPYIFQEKYYQVPKTSQKLLRFLINYSVIYDGDIHPTQERLSRKAYCSRETVNRNLRKLERLGLISSRRRMVDGKPISNIYKINIDVKDRNVTDSLREIFPIFKHLYYSSLYAGNHIFQETSHNINSDLILLKSASAKYKLSTESINARARERVQNLGEEIMATDFSKVNEVKSLKLTNAGKIKLMAFPQEALALADKRLLYKAKLRDEPTNPYRYFIAIALAYCKEKNIKPDYKLVFRLFQEANIEDEEPYVVVETISSGKVACPQCTQNNKCENCQPVKREAKCDCPKGHPYKHWPVEPTNFETDQVMAPSWYSTPSQRAPNHKRDPMDEAARIKELLDSGYFKKLEDMVGKDRIKQYVERSMAMWLDKVPAAEAPAVSVAFSKETEQITGEIEMQTEEIVTERLPPAVAPVKTSQSMFMEDVIDWIEDTDEPAEDYSWLFDPEDKPICGA